MLTVFNQGGQVTVTPTASDTPDLNITIEGTAYNEAWDTNVATTIDNWISSHAQNVADRFGIAAIDGSTVLTLQGVSSASIVVNEADGNVVATAATSQIFQDLAFVESASPSSAKVLVCTLSAQATNATLTLTFVSADDRVKGENELFEKINAASRLAGGVVFNTACSAALA